MRFTFSPHALSRTTWQSRIAPPLVRPPRDLRASRSAEHLLLIAVWWSPCPGVVKAIWHHWGFCFCVRCFAIPRVDLGEFYWSCVFRWNFRLFTRMTPLYPPVLSRFQSFALNQLFLYVQVFDWGVIVLRTLWVLIYPRDFFFSLFVPLVTPLFRWKALLRLSIVLPFLDLCVFLFFVRSFFFCFARPWVWFQRLFRAQWTNRSIFFSKGCDFCVSLILLFPFLGLCERFCGGVFFPRVDVNHFVSVVSLLHVRIVFAFWFFFLGSYSSACPISADILSIVLRFSADIPSPITPAIDTPLSPLLQHPPFFNLPILLLQAHITP